MKPFILVIFFLILQSCADEYNSSNIDSFDFDAIQILRDGTKVDTVSVDTLPDASL
tara:strand:+ start:299 stop:466 length:168 start_codon:yes stop_codon:yes gene_type:complete